MLRLQVFDISTTTKFQSGGGSLLQATGTLDVALDFSMSQMWLPADVCDSFARAFDLTEAGGLYFSLNSTSREALQSAMISFQVGSSQDRSSRITFNIPYRAFDLVAGSPLTTKDRR